jgi:ATP-binding cassette subfamily B protein IrtA
MQRILFTREEVLRSKMFHSDILSERSKDGQVVVNQSTENDKDDYLFKNFNLEIKEGTTNAIVGPSGFGKTTMLMLMVKILNIVLNIIIV